MPPPGSVALWLPPAADADDLGSAKTAVDILVRLPGGPHVVEAQVRIVLAWQPKNVTVHARRVLPPTLATTDGDDEPARPETGGV